MRFLPADSGSLNGVYNENLRRAYFRNEKNVENKDQLLQPQRGR